MVKQKRKRPIKGRPQTIERFMVGNKPPARIAFILRASNGRPVYVEDNRPLIEEKDV